MAFMDLGNLEISIIDSIYKLHTDEQKEQIVKDVIRKIASEIFR